MTEMNFEKTLGRMWVLSLYFKVSKRFSVTKEQEEKLMKMK